MRGRLASKHGASFLFGALAGVDSLPACALKRGREGAVRRLLIGRSAFSGVWPKSSLIGRSAFSPRPRCAPHPRGVDSEGDLRPLDLARPAQGSRACTLIGRSTVSDSYSGIPHSR